jgi:hypothetical protein
MVGVGAAHAADEHHLLHACYLGCVDLHLLAQPVDLAANGTGGDPSGGSERSNTCNTAPMSEEICKQSEAATDATFVNATRHVMNSLLIFDLCAVLLLEEHHPEGLYRQTVNPRYH